MRLVVYTVLIGDKEALNDPLQMIGNRRASDLELDFVCFTDNPALTSPTWAFRPMPQRLIPADRLSRLPKAMPHQFFDETQEYSLYIDNTVVFKRLPTIADLGQERGTVFRAFRHPWRNCPQDEADVVVRSGFDEAETVAAQTGFYDRRHPLRSISVLTAGTALLRCHHDPRVRRFGMLWWEQILLFSKRDQLSLDQCAHAANCPIDHFPGNKTNSDLIAWPALAQPRRVESSFDAERYAWEHRQDPLARSRPGAHYLLHGDPAKYERRPAWLRYCCLRSGSGLGTRVAPRRGLDEILEPILWGLADRAAEQTADERIGILVVGVDSTETGAAAAEELPAAAAALTLFFRFLPAPVVLTTMVTADDVGEPVPYQAAFGVTGFRLVLVLGLPADRHAGALAKFQPLLHPEGTLVIQFTTGLSGAALHHMEVQAEPAYRLSVFHGRHISVPDPIPASVVVARPG